MEIRQMNEKIDKLVEVSKGIEYTIENSIEHWRDVPEPALKYRPDADAWSPKEIIGHLIDSASNNHQRFVRLQLTARLTFPDYGQDNIHWVTIQNYQERRWTELLDLWSAFNFHMAHIVRTVDPACLSHVWQVDPTIQYTLFHLMVDYLRHLKDHVNQIDDTLNAFKES
jgi:hypothetical protein